MAYSTLTINYVKFAANTQVSNQTALVACPHCCYFACADKKFLLSLGITKEEFHAMTWFTSWAVDADHSSEHADMLFNATNIGTL